MARVCRYYCKTITLMAILLLGAGCASEKSAGYPGSHRSQVPGKTWDDSVSRGIERRLRSEYQMWKGTRHAMGGTDRSGVDCSGFVKSVYKSAFNEYLPRTTKDQVRVGSPVSRRNLRPGDLVFFRPPSYPRHVGIYLSRNEFMHASKTKGVTISPIDPSYWSRYYWTARRILP